MKKKSMLKSIIKFMLVIAMVTGAALLPGSLLSVRAEATQLPDAENTVSATFTKAPVDTSYVDDKGASHTAQAIPLDDTMTNLGASNKDMWYVVSANTILDYTETITLAGNVNLILADGAVMNVGTETDRISGSGISGNGKNLTVYGQSNGENAGILKLYNNTINDTNEYGIYMQDGSFIQNSGKVVADHMINGSSENNGGGIYCENFTVNGGSLDAQSKGSNAVRVRDDITINGGSVTIRSTNTHALLATNGGITINGGSVNAVSESINAAINGCSVTIKGGSVSATNKNTDTNYPNAVMATGGDIILGGSGADDSIFAGGYIVNTGCSVKVPEGRALIDDNGILYKGTLTPAQIAGKTLRPAYTVTVNIVDSINGKPVEEESKRHGRVEVSPKYFAARDYAGANKEVSLTIAPDTGWELASFKIEKADGSTVEASGAGDSPTFEMPAESVTVAVAFSKIPVTASYVAEDGTSKTVQAIPLDKTMTTLGKPGTGGGIWYVVKENITFDEGITFYYDGTAPSLEEKFSTVNLILGDGCTMSVGTQDEPINGGCVFEEHAVLNIYSQEKGTGALEVFGSGETNAIDLRMLTIYGGKLIAKTADNTAIYVRGGDLSIHGGNVSVTAGKAAAVGFPEKNGEVSGTVLVQGGEFTAESSSEGSGYYTVSGGARFFAGNTIIKGPGISEDVELSYNDPEDSVFISAFAPGKNVTIDSNTHKEFTDGTKLYAGVLSDEQKTEIAGKTLYPGCGVSVQIQSQLGGNEVAEADRHGLVTPSKTLFKLSELTGSDQTVTLTIAPQTGYKLSGMQVVPGYGPAISTTRVSNTQYTFTMPPAAVTVTAAFLRDMGVDMPVEVESHVRYTGEPVTPEVTVTDDLNNGAELTEGTDFTVSYDNNTGFNSGAATATVTVTGIGAYTGSKTESFIVMPFELALCTISGKLEAYIDPYYGLVVVSKGLEVWGGDAKLERDTDYSVEIEDAEEYEVGETYTATVRGEGDWSGTKTITVTLIALEHTVVFDPNGGSGEMADYTIGNVDGSAGRYYVPECTFTAPYGKTFDYWLVDYQGIEEDPIKRPATPDHPTADYFTAPFIWDESCVTTITVTAIWRDLRDDEKVTITASGLAHGSLLLNGEPAALTDGALSLFEGGQITVVPNDGYVIDTVSYNDGSDHTITPDENGVYSFTMPAANITVTATFAPDLTQWAGVQAAFSAGGDYTLTHDVTAVSTETALTVPSGKTVTLDLNGHSLNRALTSATENGNVITVSGSLTVTDSSTNHNGSITGGFNSGNGGGVVVTGTVYDDNYEIVADGGVFTMTGGTITGNKATHGGVYLEEGGSFSVEGAPVISGNTRADGIADNVHLNLGSYITVTGALQGANIGVAVWDENNQPFASVFTKGYAYDSTDPDVAPARNSGVMPSTFFHSDVAGFDVGLNQTKALEYTPDNLAETVEATLASPWVVLGSRLLFELPADDDGVTRIKLDKDYVAVEGSGGALEVPAGRKVELDLNGNTLNRNLAEAEVGGNGHVIRVYGAGSALTVTDSVGGGKITGGYTTGDGGGVRVSEYASFTLAGGSITGNQAAEGGGVYASNVGTFNMTGGSITGNQAAKGGGVGIYGGEENQDNEDGLGQGTFNLSGGSITGNTASDEGGGVWVQNGRLRDGIGSVWSAKNAVFNIEGDPVISGNVSGGTLEDGVYTGGSASNVYLCDTTLINVTDDLTNTTPIGVATKIAPTAAVPVIITSGLEGNGTEDNFASENSDCVTVLNAAGECMLAVPMGVTKYVPGYKAGELEIPLPELPDGASYRFTIKTDESDLIDTLPEQADGALLRFTINSGKSAGTTAVVHVAVTGVPNYPDYSLGDVTLIVSEYEVSYAWPARTNIWLDADNELQWSEAGVTLDRSRLTVVDGTGAAFADYTAKVGDTALQSGENTLNLDPGAYRIKITGDGGKLDDWVEFKVVKLIENDPSFVLDIPDWTYPDVAYTSNPPVWDTVVGSVTYAGNTKELSKENISKGDGIDNGSLKLWFTNADRPHCSSTVFLTKELTIEDFYYGGGGWHNITPFGSVDGVGNHNVYLPNHVTVKQLFDDDGEPVPAGDSGGKIYYMCDSRPDLHVEQSEVEEDGKTVTVLTLYEGSEPVPEGYYFRNGNDFYYGNGENAYKAYGGEDGFISFWPVKSYAQGTVYPMGDKPVGLVLDTDGDGNPKLDENGDPKYVDHTLGCGNYTKSRDSHYEARPDYWSTVYVGQNYFYYIGGGFLYTGNVRPTVNGSTISIGDYQVDMGEGVAIAWLPNDTIDGSQATDEWNWPHAYARYKADDYHYQIADQRFIIYPNNSLITFKDKQDVYHAGDTANIVIELKQRERGMNVFVNGSFYQRFEGYGDHPLTITDLREGKYTIDMFGEGDDYVTSYSTYTSFTVVRTDSVLTLTGDQDSAGVAFANGAEIAYHPENTVVVHAANDAAVSGASWKWTISDTDVVTQDHILNESGDNAVNSESIYLNTVGLGEVTLTARFSGDEIYYPARKSITFTVVPMQVASPIVALESSDPIYYDGQPKEPAVKVCYAEGKEIPADQYTVTYANNTNATTADSKATITVKSKDDALYAFDTSSAPLEFVIEKAPVTINPVPAAAAITYGQTLNDSTLTGGTAQAGETLVEGTFAWTNKTTAPQVSDSDSTDFDVTFTPDNTNYSAATCKVKLTVNPKPVTITGLSAGNKTYDGTTAATVTGTATIDGVLEADRANVSVTAGSAAFADANVGTGKTVSFAGYSLTGTAAGNYALSAQPASVTANIAKAPLTVTADSDAKTYDGAPLAKGSYTYTKLGTGDSILSVTVTGSQTNAGSSGNVPSAALIQNGAGADVTANYAITYENGTLMVNPAPVTLTANSGTATYDGTAKTVTGFTSSVNGLSFSGVSAGGSGTNAGTYAVTFSGVTLNTTKDSTGNYVVTGTTNGKLTINPASVTLTANSGTEVYDGTAKTVTGFTSSVNGLSFTGVTASGKGTNAGEYAVAFTGVTVNTTKDTTGNYVVTGTTNGKLTINPASVTLTANSGTKTYTGAEQSVTGFTSSVSGLSFTGVSAGGKGTNAGEYAVAFTGVTVNTTKDTTGNYVVTGTTNGKLTINPASVTLIANSGTKTYTGAEQSVTGFTSSVNGLSFTGVTASGKGTNAGEYAVAFSGVTVNTTKDSTGNYVVTGTTNGKLTINPASVTLTANSGTKTYTGAEQSVTGFTSSVNGLSFTGVTASGSGTNAGEYAVAFSGVTVNTTKDSTGNYVVTGTTNGKLTINPASVTLTANSGIKTYTGAEQSVTGFTSSVNGLSFTGVTASGSGTNAGTYAVTFTGVTVNTTKDSTGNYVVTGTTNGKLTIKKAASSVENAPAAKELTYDGSAQALVTAGEAAGGTMQYALGTSATDAPDASAYVTSIPTGTDAGNYYVWYKVVGDDNHNDTDAVCVPVTVKYLITWTDENDNVLATTEVESGATPAYPGSDPTKSATAQYTYTFTGWTPEITAVTGNATYKASFTATKNCYTITWLNDDNSEIDKTTVEYGTVPTHADPTKAATAEYTYTFAGWTPEVVAVTGNASYKATFTATKNSYTITWKNYDGSIIDTTTVESGVKPSHTAPTRDGTAEYSYSFAGWSPALTEATGDATYTATFNAMKKSYTITWLNDDDSVIDKTTVEYGNVPTHADATKAATAEYTYTFAGWTPEVVAVTGNATYKASFTATKNSYTITWLNDDDSVIDTTTVEYGTVPTHANPTKAKTAQYTYTFAGWTPEITQVTADATYKATYTSTVRKYTIKFVNDDGTVLQSKSVSYGTKPTYTGETPTKAADAQYTYTFKGWTPSIAKVTKAASYKATYTAIPVFGPATFTLPASTKSVGESAFEGLPMTIVEIPSGCTSIGAKAFKDCANLTQIRIPASVTSIDTTAFEGCEKVLVYGTADSAAQTFCADHANCTFVAEN